MKYFALAYYKFTQIEDPHLEVKRHKKYLNELDVSARIYLSEEGINGQMSGRMDDAERYMQWMRSDPRFADMLFKIHEIPENVFPRVTVKYRKQLVALDEKIDTSEGGPHVSPEEWREMLESGEYLLLDVRNDYEWKIGHFEGAVCPPLKKFREFPEYAQKLSEEVDPAKTKVMMYCTGGIRCELYSALLKKKGFEEVYQLDGGVINYGLKEGKKHWKGKLFVFDDRLAVDIDGVESEPIASCCHCGLPCDTYYNCANMDCNNLFISCESCADVYKGCCGHECTEAPRLRIYQREGGNKPFRKKHLVSCALNQEPALQSQE